MLELLVVIAIIAILMVLVAPAFTNLKSANDITTAASTIKGVLDTARTYAQANNTYTWVGFYEEDGGSTSTSAGTGRIVISTVASKDGTIIYNPSAPGTGNLIDPTRLIQVNKLLKIENVHLYLPPVGTGTGETFDTRPALQSDGFNYNTSRFGELKGTSPNTAPYDSTNSGVTKFPFQYPVGNPAPTAQYTFTRTLRFGPTGENRINSTFDVRTVIELALVQTHATATPVPASGVGSSAVVFNGNVLAIQIGGFDGDVKVYRK